MKPTLASIILLAWMVSPSAASVPASGHQIGIGDFGPGAAIQDYEHTGITNSVTISTPRTIGNATYNTDDHKIRFAQFSDHLGTTGGGLGTNTTLGFLDITLQQPAYRAGIVTGNDDPWSATASFFDVQDGLLGDVFASGTTGMFVGWQADDRLIKRIRITDTADAAHIIMFDNLYTESIPEPSTLLLAIPALMALLRWRRSN